LILVVIVPLQCFLFLMLYLSMIYWFLILLLILIIIVAASFVKKRSIEKKTLAGIREHWGQPKAIHRNFKLIAAYLTAFGGEYAASANDLDLDDVFAYIDRAASKPGQQYLFKKLHSPNISEGSFKPLEQLIEKFNTDPQLREQAELKLSALNSDDAYHLPELFCKKQQSLFDQAVQFYIRMAAPLVIALAVGLIIAPNQVYALLLFVCIIANFIIHYGNKSKMLAYTHSLPQLIKLYNAGKWLSDNDLLEKSDGFKQSLANMANLKKSLSFINVQNKIAADPTDITLLFAEWIKIFFLLEPLSFVVSIDKVNKYAEDIRVLFDCVGEVDMAISVLSVRTGLPYYCKPEFFSSNDHIIIKDLVHPLIENCVANSISIDNRQGVLVTGSNMSGKTTFIRTIAINALLAQTINTSFATVYKAPPLQILTSINMSDDLGGHTSYFQAEAKSIRDIIRDCDTGKHVNSLVIIDEIFRGTNTIERIAAAKAVLSYFIENKNFVLVSTHDLVLAALLGSDYKVFSF
jgi:ABC-type multidrug transport system fused ATPase/permease subunit